VTRESIGSLARLSDSVSEAGEGRPDDRVGQDLVDAAVESAGELAGEGDRSG